MTVEELNTVLYKKMFAEQEEFKERLLAMDSRGILDNAYKYVMREDILLNMEYNDLSEKQCRALLKLHAPLETLYDRWQKIEDSHMEEIRDMTEYYADSLIRDELARADMDAR